MHTILREYPDASERAFIDEVIASQSKRPGALLGILETVQEHHSRVISRASLFRRAT